MIITGACSNATVPNGAVAQSNGLNTRVAAIGQTIRITGEGFGPKPGEVLFAAMPGPHVAGRLQSWSDKTIQAEVPASAVAGPVEVVTSAGEPFYVGPLVIEGPSNGVARITYELVGSNVEGEPITVRLTAVDSSGRGVPNAAISVTDGIGTVSCTTNSIGTCAVSITPYSGSTYIALSGSAWTSISIKPAQPPSVSIALKVSSATLLVGRPATITVTVRNASGDAMANLPLSFETRGSTPVTLSASHADTDSSGLATFTATSSFPGVAFITVMTSDSASTANVEVGWSTALVTGISPNHGPTQGNTLVTVSGSGFTTSAKVYFGTQQASRTTFISSSTLTAIAPAGLGTVDVRVEVSGATSDLTPADAYTYGT